KALRERNPGVEIRGVGGERMAIAGVSLIFPITSGFGLTEVIRGLGELRRAFRKVREELRLFRPQVLVLIDYPDFNLRIAPAAKEMGIRVLYYVSPQVWAWRKGRMKRIGRGIDMMAAILPFEEPLYRERAIPCEFVGHPVMDEIREVISEVRSQKSEVSQNTGSSAQGPEVGACGHTPLPLKRAVRRELGLNPEMPVITVMPGSRPHEITRLLPLLSGAVKRLKEISPDFRFLLPVAPNLSDDLVRLITTELSGATIVRGDSIRALMAADMAVIASGTSTLQATLLGIPHLVVYRLSSLSYRIAKIVVKVKHISLANVILDHLPGTPDTRTKELIQDEATEEAIVAELVRIKDDKVYREALIGQMERVSKLFSGRSASLRVSELAEEAVKGHV
ncbi:MAG: hypothetical protein HGA78_09290, partial [Nitrospirales bacterium]|nr:hypothetical protein [Nitrospirales bacterium]